MHSASPAAVEVYLYRLYVRVGGIGKVDGNDVAHAGSHLVHQARRACQSRRSPPTGRSGRSTGEMEPDIKQSFRITPISTSKAAEEETPLPLGTLELMYTSRPGELCAPLGKSGALTPQDGGAGVFLLLRVGRSARSMTHRGYPSLYTRSWPRLLGAAAAIISS